MPAGRFSVSTIFRAIDRFSRPVRKMETRTKRFLRSMKRGMAAVGRPTSKLAAGLRKVGIAAGVAGAAVGLVARDIIKTGAEFEQAITDVGAVSLKTRDQIGELEAKAKQLGATTKFTATEVASGMEIMAKAGFDTTDILGGIKGVLDAASASGLELAEVTSVVSNALKGFGLDAGKAGDVADILALASTKTNSTIGSLGESLKNVAATARQLNIPITDVTAAVALLQDGGLDASVAGSSLNTMLTKLSALTPGVAKKLDRMGVKFKDGAGNALPFAEIMENVSVAVVKAGGNMDQIKLIAEAVGLRGQKAALALQNMAKTGRLKKLTEQLEEARGSAGKMAAIRMDTLQGDFTLLKSAADALKVKLFEIESGPLRGIVSGMKEWIEKNEEVIAADFSDTVTQMKILGEFFEKEFTANLKGASDAWRQFTGGAEDAERFADDPVWRQFAKDMGAIAGGIVIAVVVFGALARAMFKVAAVVTGALWSALKSIVDPIVNIAETFRDTIDNIAIILNDGKATLAEKIRDVAGAIFLGFTRAIIGFHTALWNLGAGFAINFVKGVIDKLKSKSPSKAMADIGIDAGKGFVGGIDKSAGMVAKSSANMAQASLDAVAGVVAKAPKLPVHLRLVHSADRAETDEERDEFAATGTDGAGPMTRPQLTSVGADQVARSVTESTQNSNATLTIVGDTERAQLTNAPTKGRARIKMAPSGGF